MKKNFDRALLADVAEQLINHLRNRTDVQNIDLINFKMKLHLNKKKSLTQIKINISFLNSLYIYP